MHDYCMFCFSWSKKMLRSLLLSAFLAYVSVGRLANAYQSYQTLIPNGDRVPSPCNPAMTWSGVGHYIPAGGGDRNPFGQSFRALNRNWTALCPLDSDGDGQSNGAELGDPTCTWMPSKPFPNATRLTHPGICEPLNDTKCMSINSWLTCPPKKLVCPAIQQSGVMNMSVQLPPTRVPAKQTTYMCYGFVFPNDTDYHVIATAPIIANPNILHHMLVFACKDPPMNADVFSRPIECNMGAWGCNALIGLWGVGGAGQCMSDAYGYRIGLNGYRYAVLQVHWNNALMLNSLIDNPGMLLYYTKTLRPNDGTIVITGQNLLTIPPRQPSVSASGTCSSRCTKAALPRPVNIASAVLHMHLLGTSGDILLMRNGTKTVLVNQTTFDFNTPEEFSYATPFVMQPGDEIRVDCTYNSMTRNVTTTEGEATTDEMCLGFIAYYPASDKFTDCVQYGTTDLCMQGAFICNLAQLAALTTPSNIMSSGCNSTACPPSCRTWMQSIAATGCVSGDAGLLLSRTGHIDGFDSLLYLQSLCGLGVTSSTSTTAKSMTSVAVDGKVHRNFKLYALASVIIALYAAFSIE